MTNDTFILLLVILAATLILLALLALLALRQNDAAFAWEQRYNGLRQHAEITDRENEVLKKALRAQVERCDAVTASLTDLHTDLSTPPPVPAKPALHLVS